MTRPPSRRRKDSNIVDFLRRFSENPLAQKIDGSLRLTCCSEDCLRIVLEEFEVMRDIGGVWLPAVDSKFSAEKRSANLGDQFFRRFSTFTKANTELTIQT